jgi:hypothetical protein
MKLTLNQKAAEWAELALEDLLDQGHDRQTAANEILVLCARLFGGDTANAVEKQLGIRFVISRAN